MPGKEASPVEIGHNTPPFALGMNTPSGPRQGKGDQRTIIEEASLIQAKVIKALALNSPQRNLTIEESRGQPKECARKKKKTGKEKPQGKKGKKEKSGKLTNCRYCKRQHPPGRCPI